ncbi:SIR2 family protein [Brevibacillus brevis]|nr:SIR2 family protein [Brevibacillus brevis]
MNAEKYLDQLLKQSESLPFLFVGSGMSLRYLSTKNWIGLLKHFANIVDKSEFSFKKYETRANQLLKEQYKGSTKNSLFTAIADLIEADFNTLWFEDERYSVSREQFKDEINSQGISPFKLEIAKFFRSVDLSILPEKYLNEIQLMKAIGNRSIAGIITTNYDLFIESVFPDYTAYIGQEELIFSPTYGIGEIYKIHGCCTNPSTIVLNTDDYAAFDKRNAYLAAKLMTIFVEHPIIFVGYSLDDENVQAIIKSIVDCLSEEKLIQLQDRLIFVEWKEGQKLMEIVPHTRDFGAGKAISMTKIITDSYEDIYRILAENKSKYSTRFFRRLKQDMYELTLTSQGTERIAVMPLSEELMQKEEDPQVVIGFGILELARQGYEGISAERIFKDVVFDRENYNIDLLVKHSLPAILKRVAYHLPVFKYLKDYNGDFPFELERFRHFKFDDLLNKTIKNNRISFRFNSIEDVISREPTSLSRQVRFIQTIEEEKMDIDRLKVYLQDVLTKHPGILSGKHTEAVSGMKKLIRMYDYLKYKKRERT